MSKNVIQIPDPNESWAQVELWRWQYGDLPQADDMRPLSVPAGLRAMADAIEKKDVSNFPSPIGVMSVLRYAAKLLEAGSGLTPTERKAIKSIKGLAVLITEDRGKAAALNAAREIVRKCDLLDGKEGSEA